jgi:hypothetical protein
MELTELTTFAGLAVAVMLIFEAAKRVLKWSPELLDRFGVLVSVGIGVALAVPAALLTTSGIVDAPTVGQAIMNGVMAGLAAVGIFKGAQASPLPIG